MNRSLRHLIAGMTFAASLVATAHAERIAAPEGASKTMRTLLAGIDSAQSVDVKLKKLMLNMKKIGFKYLGKGAGPWQAFLTGTGATQQPNSGPRMRTPWGDCGTVVNLFMKVAKEQLGIDTLTKGEVRGVENHFWTEGAPIVDPARKRGNVAAKYWFWTSHVWVVNSQSQKVYDVLFNKTYSSEENMKTTAWHVITPAQKQTYTVAGKSLTKYVLKPTLTFYANPNRAAPPTHAFLVTPPKGAVGATAKAKQRAAPAKKKQTVE